MKKLLFLGCLLLFFGLQVKSQIDSVQVTKYKGSYHKMYFSQHTIAGIIGDNLCELFYGYDPTNMIQETNKVDIILRDKNTLEYKETLTLYLKLVNEGQKNKNLEFNHLFILNSSVAIVSSRRGDKNKTLFYAQLFDFDFKPKGNPVLIAEETDTKKNIYQYKVSNDKKSFSFATIINDYEIGVYLISDDLRIIAQTHQKGSSNLNSYSAIVSQFSTEIIDNSCLITILLGEADAKDKRKYKISLSDSAETSVLSWGKEGIEYCLPEVTDYNNGVIKVSGFYYTDKEKLEGVTTASINKNTKQIESVVYSEFTNENLNKNNPYKDVTYSSRTNIRYIHKKDNGDVVITGDESYATIYSNGSKPGSQIYYHYENIIIVVLGKDGNVKMHGKIERNSLLEPFMMCEGLSHPLVFYLDNRKNYEDSIPRGKPKKHMLQMSNKKIVGVYNSVTDDAISKPFIFFKGSENRKYLPILPHYQVLSDDEILFFSRKGHHKYTIYKVKFYWQE